MSEDPIGFAAGDPNLYRYVGNQPNNWIDPLGLDQQDVEDAVMESASIANLISGQQQVNENPSNAFNPSSPGFIPSMIANAIGSLFDAVPAAIAEGSEEARRQLECKGKESDNKFVEAVTEMGEALTHLGEAASENALDRTQGVLEKGGAGAADVHWPPNKGFQGEPDQETLEPGTRMDRYGDPGGSYTAPVGTPIPRRALYPGTDKKPYHVYQVLKPLTVQSGTTAPWFGQPGGGTQYHLSDGNGNNVSVQQLIDGGFLSEVNQ